MTHQVDASGWPLVVLKPVQFGNDASLSALSDELREVLDRGDRFCMLADLARKTYMELSEVKHLSELLRSEGERLDACVAALALIVPSAMVRGAINLVLKARPPNYPYAVLRTRREAKRYIKPYLAELRMSVDMGMSVDMSLPTAVGH